MISPNILMDSFNAIKTNMYNKLNIMYNNYYNNNMNKT
jgi:hypothetical protein